MSFDVYLQCFERGEPAGIDGEAVRALFPRDETKPDLRDWEVQYDERNWCDISIGALAPGSSLVTGLSVSRPCGDLRLWEALLAVMKMGNVVLYFPGDAPPLVASRDVAAHLPRDMIEALGEPRVVTSARDILDIIRNA